MSELANFILKHHEYHRKLNPEIFKGWLGWHIHNGFVIRAVGDNEETVGVGVIRPVMKAEDADDHYEFDPEGPVLFVDLLICKNPLAMKAIAVGVLQRFGMRESVAWKKPPYYVTQVHSAARLRRHLFRKACNASCR